MRHTFVCETLILCPIWRLSPKETGDPEKTHLRERFMLLSIFVTVLLDLICIIFSIKCDKLELLTI